MVVNCVIVIKYQQQQNINLIKNYLTSLLLTKAQCTAKVLYFGSNVALWLIFHKTHSLYIELEVAGPLQNSKNKIYVCRLM